MRVAINALSDINSGYGAGIYLIGLARALSRAAEVDLIILVGRGATRLLPEDLQRHACELSVPTCRSYLQIAHQSQICELLSRKEIDLYHLPNTLPLGRKSVPTVVTIHDLADIRVRKHGWLRTGYRWCVNWLASRSADHIITVSENSKRDIMDVLNIPEEKITVTFEGIDDRFRVMDQRECKERLHKLYDVGSDFVLAPGGLSRNKNLENLFLAFAELKSTEPQLSLVLTGYGAIKEMCRVRNCIARFGLADSVVLTGYVDQRAMPLFYGACKLVVYPSLYEGFGLPALEAMSAGVPLVVSNTSSLPEIVGDAGLFVDPRDPRSIAEGMKRLLNDQDLRTELVSRGLERARLFSWQKAAEKSVEVYQRVLSHASMSGCQAWRKRETRESSVGQTSR